MLSCITSLTGNDGFPGLQEFKEEAKKGGKGLIEDLGTSGEFYFIRTHLNT